MADRGYQSEELWAMLDVDGIEAVIPSTSVVKVPPCDMDTYVVGVYPALVAFAVAGEPSICPSSHHRQCETADRLSRTYRIVSSSSPCRFRHTCAVSATSGTRARSVPHAQ